MILFLLLLLFLVCIIPPGPSADIWAAKGPPPGLYAKGPPPDCIPKGGPHEKPKKPPEKHKNKNNITIRKDCKSDLLRAVFGVRCFQDPRTTTTGRPDPARFSRVKCGSDVNRGWPGRGEKKEINQNKPRARARAYVKICVYAYVHERKFLLL